MYDYYPIKEAISTRNAHVERFETIEVHLDKVAITENTESTFL